MRELKILIEKQVDAGAVMPGSVKKQYNVCGKAHCACKDKNNPRKHGPYNQLSFSTKGKSSTMLVKSPDLKTAKDLTASYKKKRVLVQEIGLAMVTLSREVGIQEAKTAYENLYEQALRKHLGNKPESQKLKEASASRDKWKIKAVDRKSEIEKLRVKVRDLTESRNAWKDKAMLLKEDTEKLISEAAGKKTLLKKTSR